MTDPLNISIKDFTYNLPPEKIALYPLKERDASKLLIYKNGKIEEDLYENIAAYIPAGSLLVFNNSKVINARIKFQKPGGGIIEIFCLEPYELIHEYSSIMNKTGSAKWKCFIGGAAKWKGGKLEKKLIIKNEQIIINAVLIEKLPDAYVVEFLWQPLQYSFAEIIESAGNVPLPPYIKRETETTDASRYQTIYARHDGSVAAPTAGLHFTENVFSKMNEKNISKTYVTLHVGAGTFKPVKAATMQEHEMHAEWIDVNMETISHILDTKEKLITVGTTSLRTVETLYWLGVKIYLDPTIKKVDLKQWDIFNEPIAKINISADDALNALIQWMKKKNLSNIFTQTQLLITPGYSFKIARGLITNFHQPQSTLLLLVAAAVGGDWKKIYNYALEHGFRFLSYGDGNFIYPLNT